MFTRAVPPCFESLRGSQRREAVESLFQQGGGAMAYSKDLRVRYIRAVNGGRSCRSQAKVFEITAATAVKWMQAYRMEGREEAKPRGGGRHSPLAGYEDWLKARILSEPGYDLARGVRGAFEEGACDEQKRGFAIFDRSRV